MSPWPAIKFWFAGYDPHLNLASAGPSVIGNVNPITHKISQVAHVDETALQPLDLAVDATGVWVLNPSTSRVRRIAP
jgi:hypothetical protein